MRPITAVFLELWSPNDAAHVPLVWTFLSLWNDPSERGRFGRDPRKLASSLYVPSPHTPSIVGSWVLVLNRWAPRGSPVQESTSSLRRAGVGVGR